MHPDNDSLTLLRAEHESAKRSRYDFGVHAALRLLMLRNKGPRGVRQSKMHTKHIVMILSHLGGQEVNQGGYATVVTQGRMFREQTQGAAQSHEPACLLDKVVDSDTHAVLWAQTLQTMKSSDVHRS